jgi:spore coat polysaccharide biosynthesis protein SpsF (cytidylyltransferase family)
MKKNFPIVIFECANSHDGNYATLKNTINIFSNINYPNLHIKFQPFSAKTISVPSYRWFKIYKTLEFKKNEWNRIIKNGYKKYQGVWLDIFDDYSIEVLEKNLNFIYGIKIQSSVLENKKIFFKLSKLNIKNKKIILNISGKKISEITIITNKFQDMVLSKIILQCGYQDYPTSLKETNFEKVLFLQKKFPLNEFSYADHLDSVDIKSLLVPIKALQYNCKIIEKHIAIKGKKAKYDNFSSLNFKQTLKMINIINFFLQQDTKKFISKKENLYLKKTIQIPVANTSIKKNCFISIDRISYLRTNYNIKKIYDFELKKNYLSKKNIKKNEFISKKNIKKLRIGVFIACRLKSSRLKKKAILKLTKEHSLIEKCILSAKKIKCADLVVLTTSYAKEDSILKKYCQKHSIKFFKGSKENVIKRYYNAAKKFNVDIIIRVTGDCPEISEEIVNILFEKHIYSNSDYSVAKDCPVGYGAEIINVNALKKIFKKKKKAEMSEYMTYYFINNPKIFKLNFVILPAWMRKKYRMTIDYQRDLKFFRELYKKLKKEKIEMNFKNLNFILKKYKYLLKINANIKLTYKSDQNLIKKINKFSTIN